MGYAFVRGFAGEQLISRQQVLDRRTAFIEIDVGTRVGYGTLDLFGDRVGVVKQEDRSGGVLVGFRHLFRRVLQREDVGADGRNIGLGHLESLAKISVEPFREVAGQFQMLFLVLPNRYEIGPVKQDIGRHQDRVREQADAGTFGVAFTLVLKLRHPLELAHPGYARKYPGQFRVGRDVGLDEDIGPFRVDPSGEVNAGEIERLLTQRFRVLRQRNGVQVDDTIETVVLVLQCDPIHTPR